MIRSLTVFSVVAALLGVAPAAVRAEAEKLFYESREEVPERYRWNLGDLFPSPAEWQKAAVEVEGRLAELAAFRDRLAESPEVLAAALDLRYELESRVDDLFVYAGQWQRADTRDPAANEAFGKAQGIRARFLEAVAFITPEIAQTDAATLASLQADPRLERYRHYLDELLRTRSHVLSRQEEEILAASSLLTSAPGDLYNTLVFSDLPWPTIADAEGTEVAVIPAQFYTYLASQDRRVRRDYALGLFATYRSYGNTLARALAASVHKDLWLARSRRYDSSLEAALDAIPVPAAVVDTLVGTVHDNFAAIHRYVALRKRVLGLEDFHIYDLYVSMVPAADRRLSYDEGWQLAMDFWRQTLGEDYAAVAERARAERWVDVYSSAGKRGGAFSWGTYNSHPYLFLNWGGTLEDVFTLVHEMGHSIHSYLSFSNQPYHYADTSLFLAEVGSVAAESLFFEWLLARTEDSTERLALLNFRMNSITGTFLRQIFFHEFEAAIHAMAGRGETLTRESLGETWSALWRSYYGPEAVLDEEYAAGWARIPHFYRTFYVWNYASSFAAGEAIAARFRSGDATAVDDYLAMLELGSSVYPMEAIERAGVEMADPQVIRTVMERYRAILGEMEALLGD